MLTNRTVLVEAAAVKMSGHRYAIEVGSTLSRTHTAPPTPPAPPPSPAPPAFACPTPASSARFSSSLGLRRRAASLL